ncbi:DUF448 domain-containing protein [uncultured Sphingomonas sp.]|uniref:DUF448 domain-containing protein n=1 Tax=uncultured Sphingomonas sp. TaxID=158754 RepID=UPI0035CBD2C1
MRPLPDESDGVTTGTGPGGNVPVRKCILSGDREPRGSLIRLALSPDGEVLPDVRAKAPGRGAWIGVGRIALDVAVAKGKLKGALARSFRSGAIVVPADLGQRVADQLQRAALDRLGLEARAGRLVTGAERIEAAARSGKAHLLLHAADAGADGTRKLDQALRVGRAREGSGDRGLALPVGRTILGLALGRENVVHVAMTDPDAARRVRDALDRWLQFIGPEPDLKPCETAPQGASALPGAVGMAEDDATEGY